MPNIKLVFYSENKNPRSIQIHSKAITRILLSALFMGLISVASVGLAVKFYIQSKSGGHKDHEQADSLLDSGLVGPSDSSDLVKKELLDRIEQLNQKLQNAQATINAPKELDKKSPALALFTPTVIDHTNDSPVKIANFKYSPSTSSGKSPSFLTFELHNSRPSETTEKGYLVVLARSDNGLLSYPNVFNKSGPYLIDFEKGETFQVARFRMVNAQFDYPVSTFQILIFSRKGELFINTLHEAK